MKEPFGMPPGSSEKQDIPLHVRTTPVELVSYSRGAFSLFSRGTLALFGVGLFSLAVAWASHQPLWGWVSWGLLTFGLAPELIPTRYTLGSYGIIRQFGPWRQQYTWLEVVDYEVSRQGVWIVVAPADRARLTFLIPYPSGGQQALLELFDYYLVAWRREDSGTPPGNRGKPKPPSPSR